MYVYLMARCCCLLLPFCFLPFESSSEDKVEKEKERVRFNAPLHTPLSTASSLTGTAKAVRIQYEREERRCEEKSIKNDNRKC